MVFALPWTVHAQSTIDVPLVTHTYALEDVRIVQAPGQIIEGGTVLFEDGVITAVGRNVTIPVHAERITGDSLVVYAGFIDGLSHAAIPEPKSNNNQPRVADPGNPPNDRAGIQPERSAHAMLKADDKSVEALRKAGFTAAHTVPYGRMLPGSGALVLLAGESGDAMLVRDHTALFAQFRGAQGMYPGTPMAMLAKFRQLYREADRRKQIMEQYASNPAGMERPERDAVHEAFFPVLDAERPVFFHTTSAVETHRALQLQQTLGFNLILSGVTAAHHTLDQLQAAQTPLFLSLDLPEAPKAALDSTGTHTPDLRTPDHTGTETERHNLEARQKANREAHYGAAAQLHDANLTFGFSTKDAKASDIHKNVRKMVEHGLSEDAALAALTTDAAEILGVSAMMGTVEVGKMANLVVTTAPYFSEDAQIRYVFIDGEKHTYEVKPKKKASDDEASDEASTVDLTNDF